MLIYSGIPLRSSAIALIQPFLTQQQLSGLAVFKKHHSISEQRCLCLSIHDHGPVAFYADFCLSIHRNVQKRPVLLCINVQRSTAAEPDCVVSIGLHVNQFPFPLPDHAFSFDSSFKIPYLSVSAHLLTIPFQIRSRMPADFLPVISPKRSLPMLPALLRFFHLPLLPRCRNRCTLPVPMPFSVHRKQIRLSD